MQRICPVADDDDENEAANISTDDPPTPLRHKSSMNQSTSRRHYLQTLRPAVCETVIKLILNETGKKTTVFL